jgi:hypothetical protein
MSFISPLSWLWHSADNSLFLKIALLAKMTSLCKVIPLYWNSVCCGRWSCGQSMPSELLAGMSGAGWDNSKGLSQVLMRCWHLHAPVSVPPLSNPSFSTPTHMLIPRGFSLNFLHTNFHLISWTLEKPLLRQNLKIRNAVTEYGWKRASWDQKV